MEECLGPRWRDDDDDDDSTIVVHEDALIEIQKRLPVKSLCRFKCVSRGWRSLISSRSFIDSHFAHSETRPKLIVSFPARNPDGRSFLRLCLVDQSHPRNGRPQLVRRGLLVPDWSGYYCSPSVEGLVCLEVASGVNICNPSTGKQVTFELPHAAASSAHSQATHSFGFDPVKREHKVLSTVLRPESGQPIMESWVLTLGTNEWRPVEHCPPHHKKDGEFCFDGVLYYTAWNCSPVFVECSEIYLVAFHLSTESFRMIVTPARASKQALIKFEGHLAVVDCSSALSGAEVIVWILEDFDREIWKKRVFVLPPCWKKMVGDSYVSAVGMVRSGELLFAETQTVSASFFDLNAFYKVFYYDLKTNGFRRSEIHILPPPESFELPNRIPCMYFLLCQLRFSDHVESLLPLGN